MYSPAHNLSKITLRERAVDNCDNALCISAVRTSLLVALHLKSFYTSPLYAMRAWENQSLNTTRGDVHWEEKGGTNTEQLPRYNFQYKLNIEGRGLRKEMMRLYLVQLLIIQSPLQSSIGTIDQTKMYSRPRH